MVSETLPTLTGIYEPLSLIVGISIMLGSLVVVRLSWPKRPRYMLLGELLGIWAMYPGIMPNGGQRHPLGYVLVLAVPFVVIHILQSDARAVLQSLVQDRTPRRVGVVAMTIFAVFFAFSAGTMSFTPENGVNLPTNSFVVVMSVADPLVVWPAVEFYFPSIPFGGYVSVGTLLLMGFLGGLVGLNTAVFVQQWNQGADATSGRAFLGTFASSGATACCCCAPALYGLISAVFGATASPLYWAFLNPASPVGSIFFAATVFLLVGSVITTTSGSSAASVGQGVTADD